MPYTKLHTWYKMVTANCGKFSSVSCKIFPSNAGEPSRSTVDAQTLLFWLRSRHDCRNTIISFVLLSSGTIWAAKHCTKVHHCAKTSRWPSNWSSNNWGQFVKSRDVTSLLKRVYTREFRQRFWTKRTPSEEFTSRYQNGSEPSRQITSKVSTQIAREGQKVCAT